MPTTTFSEWQTDTVEVHPVLAALGLDVVMVGGTLIVLGPLYLNPGYLLWTASIVTEYVIMASTALFFAMILSSARPLNRSLSACLVISACIFWSIIIRL